MSIDQIQLGPISPVDQALPYRRKESPARDVPNPDPRQGPSWEKTSPQTNANVTEAPAEEIKLQRDSSTGRQIYQFIDSKSGLLILQIPSEQMLNFIHEVQQEWEHLTARPPVETPDGKGK